MPPNEAHSRWLADSWALSPQHGRRGLRALSRGQGGARMLRLLVISVRWADSPDNLWPISDVVARFQTVAAWYAEASYGRVTLVPTVTPFVRATTTSANANAKTLLHIASDVSGALKAAGIDTT